eukprot:SAG31_NODE_10042_length_1192_cov_1.142726_1_plen_218_part_00
MTVGAHDARHHLRAQLALRLREAHIQGSLKRCGTIAELLHGPLSTFDRLVFQRRHFDSQLGENALCSKWPSVVHELLPTPAILGAGSLLPLELERAGLRHAAARDIVAQLQSQVDFFADEIEKLVTSMSRQELRRQQIQYTLSPDPPQRQIVTVRSSVLPRLGRRRGVSFTLRRDRFDWLQQHFQRDAGPRRPFAHALLSLLARCASYSPMKLYRYR